MCPEIMLKLNGSLPVEVKAGKGRFEIFRLSIIC